MPDQAALATFREVFQLDRLTVRETPHWVVSVRPEQITLAAMVLSSRHGLLHFQEMDAAAGADLGETLAACEHAAKDLFGAVRINAVCLMMKDPIIHFHILPRYAEPVERFGVQWQDRDWPGPPVFQKADTSEETLAGLAQQLHSFFQS